MYPETKRRTAVLLTVFAAALACPALFPCGYWGPSEVNEVTFFAPEILDDPGALPFFVTPYHRFYDDRVNQETPADFTTLNLDEWDAFFQKKISRAAWSALLYKAPLDRLDALIFRLKGKPDVPPVPGEGDFTAYEDRKALLAALYYVGFAKRVEPYATERADTWAWEEKKAKLDRAARDKAVAALAEGGLKALTAAKDPFLRGRYAFQLLRLFFYHDEYDRCAQFYEEHRADFENTGSIGWRALAYTAGAHYKAKRYAEANYRFSLIFDRYRPLRIAAAWSFHPQEESDWRQCLAMAKTSREKAVLWLLLGIGADGLRAMKEIAALDAKSDLLPLLLVREVNRVELEMNVSETTEPPEFAKSASRKELLAFIESMAEKGEVLKPWAWDLAAAHLHALAGDAEAAESGLVRAARRAPAQPRVAKQIRTTRLFAAVRALDEVTPAAEPMLARELAWLKAEAAGSETMNRSEAVFSWTKGRLSALYRRKGDVVTALCLLDNPEDPFYAEAKNLDRLLAFLGKPDKTAFEALVSGEYAASAGELREIKALNALYAGDAEAADALVAGLKTDRLPADPFAIQIQDNHDRDAEKVGESGQTKAEAIQRLAGLLREAKADPGKAAQLNFEAANAFYNISYFGNCRAMYLTAGERLRQHFRGLDCRQAENLYRKAMDLSPDREFKAKACFMAAKCEQNAYYARDPEKKSGDFIAGKYYALLRDTFSNTKYYQEVLRECGYFRTYLAKHPAGQPVSVR